jgi:hypothetical protein
MDVGFACCIACVAFRTVQYVVLGLIVVGALNQPEPRCLRFRGPTRTPQPRRQLGPQGQVAALLELERGAQPGLDLADGQRDPGPGLGGGPSCRRAGVGRVSRSRSS